jgi:nickel superoxide dismutase
MFKKLIKPVYAHCDVPCGVYETDTMKHAADTCLKMVEKIDALGEIDSIEKRNSLVRMVMTKEEHAQKVKDQLYLLWSDYFKPEHLQKYPKLHETIWLAAKQASKVKQTVDAKECQDLITQVQTVSDIFSAAPQH